MSFREELTTLINKHSEENCSDTPDFILAHYLIECLESFDKAVAQREEWYRQEKKEYRKPNSFLEAKYLYKRGKLYLKDLDGEFNQIKGLRFLTETLIHFYNNGQLYTKETENE